MSDNPENRSLLTQALPRRSIPLLWLATLLCIVLCPLAQGTLTSVEITALTVIFNAFPDLGSVPLYQPVFDGGIDYGRAWTSNFANLCQGGDGYEYYGLHCQNGHISGIVLTRIWGDGVSQNFAGASGLSFLVNVTALTGVSDAAQNLTKILVATLPIRSISAQTLVFKATNFGYPAELLNLDVKFDRPFNFTDFVNLRSLTIITRAYEYSYRLGVDYGVWPSTLETLVARGIFLTEFEPVFPNLTSLRHLELEIDEWYTARAYGPTSCSFNSSTLEYFSITYARLSYDYDLYLNFSSLVEANINTEYRQVQLFTPNLRKLSLGQVANFPSNFEQLVNLEELSLDIMKGVAFPDFNFSRKLRSFEIYGGSIGNDDLEQVLANLTTNCPMWSNLTLNAENRDSPFYLPPCLLNSTLKVVHLTGRANAVWGSEYDPEAILSHLPNTVESLALRVNFTSTVHIDRFKRFGAVNELILDAGAQLVGEMKNDFFQSFPLLQNLDIIAPFINGTIPSVGWASLKSVKFECRHEKWTGVDSAPLLTSLFIDSDALGTLPTNGNLLRMQNLEELYLRLGKLVDAPFPTFWTQLPKLSGITIIDSNFTGPIESSISAPRLTSLRLSGTSVCGSLPTFAQPTILKILDLSNNKFSGEIPQSWISNLLVYDSLHLKKNRLSGTIPSSMLLRSPVKLVHLDDNYFSGPVWNMSELHPQTTLWLANNNFNICAADPGIPVNETFEFCDFTNTSSCPSDSPTCTGYWVACGSIACSKLDSPRIPPVEACIAPHIVLECPLPQPTGFECIDGQWISPGSLTTPSITLPPNAGTLIVVGNLTANGTITFNGIGTTIEVRGCIENVPIEITIILDGDKPLPTTTLLTQKGIDCKADLRTISVNVMQTKESCKKTKVSTEESTPASLIVLFNIDSSKCNVKWIILGCSLGGFLVLVSVSAILIYSRTNGCRSYLPNYKSNKSPARYSGALAAH